LDEHNSAHQPSHSISGLVLQQGLLALLGQAWERLLKRRQDPALTKLASFMIRLERTGEWGQLRSKQCNFKGCHRKSSSSHWWSRSEHCY